MRTWLPQQVEPLLPSQIVSCKVVEWYKGLVVPDTAALILKALILNKPALETLHLTSQDDSAKIPDHTVTVDERLSTVKELVLHGYNWKHSPTIAITFWNWTNITYLELMRVPIIPFLRTVTPDHLLQLRTFITDSHCDEIMEDRDEANDLLCNLVSQIRALERLEMKSELESLKQICRVSRTKCVFAIATQWKSLRSLNLQGYEAKYADAPEFGFWEWKKDLLALRSWCTNLIELTLDDAILAVEKKVQKSSDKSILCNVQG